MCSIEMFYLGLVYLLPSCCDFFLVSLIFRLTFRDGYM